MKGLNSAFSNPLQFCLITLFAICYEQSAYSDFCEDTYKVLIESQQTKIHCQNFSLLFPPKIIPGLITQVLFCCSTAEQIAQTASYLHTSLRPPPHKVPMHSLLAANCLCPHTAGAFYVLSHIPVKFPGLIFFTLQGNLMIFTGTFCLFLWPCFSISFR